MTKTGTLPTKWLLTSELQEKHLNNEQFSLNVNTPEETSCNVNIEIALILIDGLLKVTVKNNRFSFRLKMGWNVEIYT